MYIHKFLVHEKKFMPLNYHLSNYIGCRHAKFLPLMYVGYVGFGSDEGLKNKASKISDLFER